MWAQPTAQRLAVLSVCMARACEMHEGWGEVDNTPAVLSSPWLLYQEERQLQAGPFLKHLCC